MPEINFYINDKEREELFDYLISNNASIVPDKDYVSRTYDTISSYSEFARIIEMVKPRFYIVSPKFSIYPLALTQLTCNNESIYYLQSKFGGPYIEICFFTGFAEDAVVQYKRTWLSHYPNFIKLQEQYEEFKATDELKEFYNGMVKFLKSKCKRIQIGDKKYWISKDVIPELNLE